MRTAFVKTLSDLASHDPRILLLTGDLGYMALEPFADRFADRFFNVGVAEQNLVGLATGLSEAGFIPFVYSIVPFAVLRPYEFIRNGAIQHQLTVRIVGVGGGFEYGTNGLSHYGLEDVGVLRLQPGIAIITPADHEQASTALCATWDMPGPVYYRLGKDDKTTVPELGGRFELGRLQILREGSELVFISMGNVVGEVIKAGELLAAQGVSVGVVGIASVSPPPVDDLLRLLRCHKVAITVEAHYTTGGIGSLVAEVIAEWSVPCRLVRCGVKSPIDGISGSTHYLYQRHGLSSEALVQTALAALAKDMR